MRGARRAALCSCMSRKVLGEGEGEGLPGGWQGLGVTGTGAMIYHIIQSVGQSPHTREIGSAAGKGQGDIPYMWDVMAEREKRERRRRRIRCKEGEKALWARGSGQVMGCSVCCDD